MQLFYSERSPYARKARAVAIEKGLKLDLVEINAHALPPQLVAHNPLSKIPVLISASGEPLVDSWVICQYLDELGDGPALIPRSGMARYTEMSHAAIAHGILDAAVPAVMESMRPADKIHQAFQDKQRQAIERTAAFFNDKVEGLAQPTLTGITLACALDYVDHRMGALGLPVDWRDGNTSLSQWFDAFIKRESMATTGPVSWDRATAA